MLEAVSLCLHLLHHTWLHCIHCLSSMQNHTSMSENRGTFSLSSGSSQIGKRLASCDNVLHRAIFYLPLPIFSAKTKSYYEYLNLKKYFKLVATLFFHFGTESRGEHKQKHPAGWWQKQICCGRSLKQTCCEEFESLRLLVFGVEVITPPAK